MVKCGREVSVLKAGVVSALTAWFCSVGNCGAVEASEEDAANCGAWAAAGECAKNPEYMKAACPVSCGDGPAGICAEHTISECPSSAKACGAVCDKNVEKAAVAATKGASVVTAQVPPVAHGPDTPDCEKHPGGCRCYYDALADGCPGSRFFGNSCLSMTRNHVLPVRRCFPGFRINCLRSIVDRCG
eukprot:TRINITY_DN29835_c0_g1_i1.p1 TRINITY_DN29835_c0_g1~~TRINITY_DN29835_c0_g1_i1.p1  ORF type:complete len:187 (-),score=21.44 TRINITY_DN29835_c0_g1_i1:33-593(-)